MKAPINLDILEARNDKPATLFQRLNAFIKRVDLCYRYLRGDVEALENKPYGSMYNHDTQTTVTISGTNTPARIPSGFTKGQINLMTFDNSREITVSRAGKYGIVWQISFTMDSGSNQEIEGFSMVNNVMNTQDTGHRKIGTGTDTGSMSGNGILDLAAGDVVALGVLNETSANDVNIEHANIKLTYEGS